jgi:uncharacterized membrane protein
MPGLRSARERVIQTLWFEGVGLALVAPLYAWATGAAAGESFVLVAALSLAVMTWSALFNTGFDWIEWRLARRLASDRPQHWRIVHAVAHEATAVIVTCPLIVALTGLGWWQALWLDVALTVVYAAYAYVFHLTFDRLRPVRA